MLRSQLVDLWKSRVQHLRQYYCFHGQKPKQRGSPAISRHVWFIPLILTLWWLLIAVIFLYTLKMEHLLSAGEILRYELYLNFLLTILWWKLAVTESEGTTKTRFRNGPHCSCTMCTSHQNGCTITRENVSIVILPLRDNWKCHRRRRVLKTVHYSDHQVVTSFLLILAGDVETNPGPGIDADNTTILVLDDVNKVMDELKNVLACYEGIGGRLDLPNNTLEVIHGENLSAAAAMRRVIVEWLNRNYPNSSRKPPTWKVLVDAVEHPLGGNNRAEAEEIANRHRADHHIPARPCNVQENESILSSETCYLPQEEDKGILSSETCYLPKGKVEKLVCPTEQSLLSQGAFNWPPKQSYLARIKKKTEDITWEFSKLLYNFCETLSKTTNDENFLLRCHMISDIFSIDSKTRNKVKASNDVKKLLEKIYEHQSFINFGILVKKLIPWFGSEQDKRNAKDYMDSFEKHVNCRIIDCSQMYSSVLNNHFSILFIIDANQDQYRIGDLFTFRLHLSEYIGIDDTKILSVGFEGGSVIVRVQIPNSFLKMLLYRPLYSRKIEAFKSTSVRSYRFKDHEVVLKHWKTLTNVSLPPTESSPAYEKQGKIIKSAHHQGEECMALVYPNQFSEESEVDIKYIEYMEVLIRDHKEVPSIKGLYYPPEEEGFQKYPVVITEKLKFLKEITFPANYDESGVNLLQISLLSNIASAAKRFEKLNHKVKVSTDHILIQEDDAEYKAKFIPVYGDSLVGEIPNNQHGSLLLDDLLWIKDIILLISSRGGGGGGSTSHVEIPGQHILKKMIEQKWLSKDTQFRPHTYSELADELQHLLETEKTWIGLIKIPADGDLVKDEVQIHVILIGHTGVGKTSLRKHLKNEPIDDNERPTIVMEPEFLYRESVAGGAFKPLLDLPRDCQSKIFLTMWDTGGQPIFQDLLPCFARLKCMYGIVFRLSDLEKFDEKSEIRPCKPLLEPTVSPFTNRDIVYRNLSFVQAFSYNTQRKQLNLPQQLKSKDSQKASTAAVVIGTHRDKTTASDEILQEIDHNIGQFASKNKSSISLYQYGESYVYKVDNTRSGREVNDSGLESLRNTISTCANESSDIEIPRSWQAFRLALQRKCYTDCISIGILPLDEAISIGKECKVKEPKGALMYFHELGVIMWYHLSEKKNIKNFVIIDPKALLKVLAALFCYDPKLLKPEWSSLIEKGIMPMSFYTSLLKKKPSKIDDSWFMEFLEEHHLSVKIGHEICYFVPSILPVPTKDDYGAILEHLDCVVSPLYIVPESEYIATGIFTRLLTALAGVIIGNTKWRIPLENSKPCVQYCRNQFKFIVNDCICVILTEFSQFIRVDCISYNDAILSEDIYYHILSTLNVQLQRIVPRWLEEREFDLTLACNNSSCSASNTKHFYVMKKLVLESNMCECSNRQVGELKKSELVWFQKQKASEKARGEATHIFDEAMDKGSLDISTASVIFFGVSDSEVTSAKHVALQEPVPTAPKSMSPVEHEIYYRAADHDHAVFKKMETNHHNEIIAFSIIPEVNERQTTLVKSEYAHKSDKHEKQSTSVDAHKSDEYEKQTTSAKSVDAHKSEGHEKQTTSARSVDAHKSEEHESKQDLDLDRFFESDSVTNTKEFISQYQTKGKMELLHVINCGSNFIKLSELLKVFIRNVTFYVFVTDLSKELHQTERDDLLQTATPSSKLLIIGTYIKEDVNIQEKIALLHKNLSNSSNENQIFPLNYKTPERQDYDTGCRVIKHVMSGTDSKKFPFSWHVFGFKLKECIASSNLIILSVERHCMKIGKCLNMNRATVEVALEHLSQHNMVLYFRDALPDIVFSGITIFSKIFSSLYDKIKHLSDWKSSIVTKVDLLNEIGVYTNKLTYISDNDLIKLFTKLMVMAPFDGDARYIIPSLLQPLNKMDREIFCEKSIDLNLIPMIIKCPTGNKFISMLISCLLNQSWIIPRDQPGNPMCLYKNCAMLRAEEFQCLVTVAFELPYVEVYVKSDDQKKPTNYHQIASIILQCLEKINTTNGHNFNFNFNNIMFDCRCGRIDEKHTCVYHSDTSMKCEKNNSIFPGTSHMKWLGDGKVQEPLTVANAVNVLLKLSDQWIRVASSLGLPSSVTDIITVSSRMDAQVALRKVVEWWFMNNANPEWNDILKVKNAYPEWDDMHQVVDLGLDDLSTGIIKENKAKQKSKSKIKGSFATSANPKMVAKYKCPDCGYKWKFRRSSGVAKQCLKCMKSFIDPYKLRPDQDEAVEGYENEWTFKYKCPDCDKQWKSIHLEAEPKQCFNCREPLIEPYKKRHVKRKDLNTRMFGKYNCSCGHSWVSGNTWIEKWQKCRKCESEVMPSDVRPLKPSRAVQNPHDTERCQKCMELGYDCRNQPSEPYYILDDNSTDSGSVFSDSSVQ